MKVSSQKEDVQLLFVQHLPALRRFLYSVLSDFSYLDDVVQETFLTVSRKADDFELETNFFGWVCAIARIKILEGTRKHNSAPRPLSDDVLGALVTASRPLLGSDDDRRLDLLEKCKGKLSGKSRKAVELRYYESQQPAEIAQHLGWTIESVHVALSKSRALLRTCVEGGIQKLENEIG